MSTVTINGHTYTDDADPSTGLGGGGHRARFIPLIQDVVAVTGAVEDLGINPTFGTVTIADGSASAPSLTNNGDANSGLYFPAADTVAIATGGSEVLRANNGKILIGTATDDGESSKLQVYNAVSETIQPGLSLKGYRTFIPCTEGIKISFISTGTLGQHDFGCIAASSYEASGDGGAAKMEFFVGGSATNLPSAQKFLSARAISSGLGYVTDVSLRTADSDKIYVNGNNVLINDTADDATGAKLQVNGDVNIRSGYQLTVNGTQVVDSRKTGWTAATGTATRTTFATSTVTTAQLAERVKALIDDLISHGLIGA